MARMNTLLGRWGRGGRKGDMRNERKCVFPSLHFLKSSSFLSSLNFFWGRIFFFSFSKKLLSDRCENERHVSVILQLLSRTHGPTAWVGSLFCRYFILWATGRATDPIFPGHGMLPVAATTMNKKKKKKKIEKRQDKAKKRVTHMGWWGIKKCNRAMKKQKEKYRNIVRIFDPIFLLENIG